MNKKSMKNVSSIEEMKNRIQEKDYQEQDSEELFKELQSLQNQKESYEEQLEMYKKDKEQQERLYEIMLEKNNFRKIEPEYEFEKDDEWWELKQEQQEQERDRKLRQLEHDIKQQKQLVKFVSFNINYISQILKNRGDLDE